MNMKKITAIITLALGLVAIILGACIMGGVDHRDTDTGSYSHSAGYYNVDGASFGADFYTYMYDASDVMVDELADINYGVSTMVNAQNDIINNVSDSVRATEQLAEIVARAGGMIVIAIGLGILAYGVQCGGRAFFPEVSCAAPVAAKEEEETVAE